VIQLTGGTQLGVVEACSGLRMLMLFFAICLGAAILLRRPLWEKIVIVISAIPIAVFSNVVRITLTAFLHEQVSAELADRVFHDLAGLLMMPLALLLLWGEMVLLGNLFLEPVSEGPLSLGDSVAKKPGAMRSQPIINVPKKG
jgi:exosortase/archaeosortase family protein